MVLTMPSSTWRQRQQKIERWWWRKTRILLTSPKPCPHWPDSSSKQLLETIGGPDCPEINETKQIPSGWTGNNSETWGGVYCCTYGHCVDIGHDSNTCRYNKGGHKENANRADIMGGNPYRKPRVWGRERVGEIISNTTNTKINISHDLRVRNLDPISDTGSTLNCLCMNSPSDYDKQIEPIRALLPDWNKINAHIQYQMNMDGLPGQAEKAYKSDNIQEPLMSIPVLCDNRCTVIFTKQSVHVNKHGKNINRLQRTSHQTMEFSTRWKHHTIGTSGRTMNQCNSTISNH